MSTGEADSPQAASSRPRRRLPVWLRLVAWSLAAAWFGWFAYVRWTTPPAAVARGGAARAGRSGVPAKLAALLEAVPRPPASGTLAMMMLSDTYYYYGNEESLLTGPWDPANRPELAEAAKYVTSKDVTAALDRIGDWLHARVDASARDDDDSQRLASVDDNMELSANLRRVVAAMCVRARVISEEEGEGGAALSLLRDALRIEAFTAGSSMHFGPQTPGIVHHELGCLAQSSALPSDAVIALLRESFDASALSLESALTKHVTQGGGIDEMLDALYTDNGRGDGWLVLSRAGTMLPEHLAAPERSGAWNLLSPCFYGRAKMRERLLGVAADLRGADSMPFAELLRRLKDARTSGLSATVLDGPFVFSAHEFNEWSIRWSSQSITERRVTAIALALSAYRHDNGNYPERLDDLIPRYVEKIPIDADSAQPFVYERREADYRLALPASGRANANAYGMMFPKDEDGLLPSRTVKAPR